MEDSSGNNESRRTFIKQSLVAGSIFSSIDATSIVTGEIKSIFPADKKKPWYSRIVRWGQVNITEKDPENYDVNWWRSYWKKTATQGVIINAGGIVAYYPSKIPLHRHAEYLKGADLFGKLCKAAHDDGLAVFARMDSNRAHEEFYKAHPDWFTVDINGNPYKAGEMFVSCVNGPYYNQHIPAIIKEICELYHPEGFTDNSWSGLPRESICYCENCIKDFHDKTGLDIPKEKNWNNKGYRQWIKWNYTRRLEIWELNNLASKTAGGADCIWSGMNSGSIHGQCNYFRDFKEISERADIIMLDDQARSNEGGFQRNGDLGKLVHGLAGWNKLVPESMAMYQGGGGVNFRLASKPAPEARMWMINGIAGGIQPWWHHVSAYHEDRRMYKTAAPVMQWHRKNEKFLINRKPVASIGVVWSQTNMDFYGRDNAHKVELPMRGLIQALIRARIPYLMVHADHIKRDANKFKVLILPNIASMTNDQVAAVKDFTLNGGSIFATGETSLYDEWGDEKNDYALSEIFGAHRIKSEQATMEKLAGNAYHTYLRLLPELRARVEGPQNGTEPPVTGKRHEVLNGFDETDILPYGGLLQSLQIDKGVEVPVTFIPQFPVYPPETAWMRQPVTDIPGLVLKTAANGNRTAFLPANIDTQFAVNNLPDHANLLENIVRWVTKNDIPLRIEGTGFIDCHLYEQDDHLLLHLVNLTSAATWRQPLEELITTGPFKINIRLPEKIKGKKAQLLVSENNIASSVSNGWIHFIIDSLKDHELVIIT
jgi:hypothetical protein